MCFDYFDITIDLEAELETSKQNLQIGNEKLKNQNKFLHSSYQQAIMSLEEEKISLNEQKKELEIKDLKEKYEAVQVELQNILKNTNEMKKEYDALQIDSVFYKTDNNQLLEAKMELDDKVKVLSEELANLQNGKKYMELQLELMKQDIGTYNDQLKKLQDINTELTELGNQSKFSHEAELKKITEDLKDEKLKSEGLELTINSLKLSVAKLERERDTSVLHTETVSKQLDEARHTISDLQEKLDSSDKKKESLYKTISELNSEISEKTIQNLCDKENYQSAMKKLEKEVKNAREVMEVPNKALKDATHMTEIQKIKIDALETESAALKEELANLKNSKEGLEVRYSKISKELVSEIKKNYQKEKLPSDHDNLGLLKKDQVTCDEKVQVVNKQLSEYMETLQNDYNTQKIQLLEISDLRKELEAKLDSQSQNENLLLNLVQVLQTIELQVTRKIEKLIENSARYIEESNNLREQLQENVDGLNDRDEECELLHRMIDVLQICEKKATEKQKELHSESIKLVEEMMDLKKVLKDSIESSTKDINNLQKKIKDMQASFKKQIQTLKQQHVVEIETVKEEKSAAEEENNELKSKLSEIQTLKQQHVVEIETVKKEKSAVEKENNELKSKLSEVEKIKNFLVKENKTLERDLNILENVKHALEKEEENFEKDRAALQKNKNIVFKERSDLQKDSTEKNNLSKESLVLKEVKVVLTKENISVTSPIQVRDGLKMAEKESENTVSNLDVNEKNMKRSNLRARKTDKENNRLCEPKDNVEAEKSKNKEKKASTNKNKTSTEKTTNSVVSTTLKENVNQENVKETKSVPFISIDIMDEPKENIEKNIKEKKQLIKASKKVETSKGKKTKENTEENSNRRIMTLEGTKAPRRQLRNLGNVAENLGLTPMKNSSENKSLKRKGQVLSPDEAFPEKRSLKKTEFHNFVSDCKPVSLRVQVLTGKIVKEIVSPKPSPRLTRGRKRITNCELFQNKENISTVKKAAKY